MVTGLSFNGTNYIDSMNKSIIKTFLKIAFAPFLWLLNGCGPLGEPVDKTVSSNHYYSPSKDDVIYSSGGNWFNLGKKNMNADVASFEVLNQFFGRDKNGVYYDAYFVENPNIDVPSFYIKSDAFTSFIGFDKSHVYYFESSYKKGSKKVTAKLVEDADPETYLGISFEWAKDRSNHFYKGTKVESAYDSFEILNDYFVRDSSQVFVRVNQAFTLLDCDQASFGIFQDTNHGMDKTYIYWLPFFTPSRSSPIAVPYLKMEKISYLNNYYLTIASKVYYDGMLMPDVSSDTFRLVHNAYAKDDEHVYFKGAILPDADVATFELRGFIVLDKNGRYEKGKIVGPVPTNYEDEQ